MATQIFVNLPVQDLTASKDFFTKIGFSLDPKMVDDTAACVVVSDEIFVMLLTEARFSDFTKRPVADATKSTEAIMCLGVESRQAVDALADAALAAGGAPSNDPMNESFMYGRSFQDPDGHLWEVVYMDTAAMAQQSQ